MTFAPALTWMHLLPVDASYECNTAPQWLADLLRQRSHADGPRFQVAFDQNLNDWTGDNANGLVAINCRALKVARLRKVGFNYVRGFAAIPNLAAARWFIPLDSGSVSSAAFNLYSPTKVSARLKRNAAQVLARTGLPIWYKDTVWIAQRQMPSLERTIAQAVPGREFRLALSAGAPEPARNRKASAAVIALDGGILGFAKISGSSLARKLLEHEASFLSLLATNASIRDCVPKLLTCGEADDRFVLVQSPVSGGAASHQLTPAHRKFLAALESKTVKPAGSTAVVTTLSSRLAAVGDSAGPLQDSLDRVLTSLIGCAVPSTFVHGDFAPWNIRQRKDLLCCYDWEYGRADGLPLMDETHHELQVGYLLHDWTIQQADRRLTEIAKSHLRYSADHVAALQGVYMIDVLLRLAEEGYPASDPMVSWTRQLLQLRTARTPMLEAAA
jgi:hypothetical protein